MERSFNEKQQFRQWWIWLLMSPLILGTIYIIYSQLILGNPVGNKPISHTGVILFTLFSICIIFFLWFLSLETTINEKGIFMKYRPILKRNHSWDDIEKVEVINYGFVGYGFRWSPKHNWIYNVSGNMGLKIYLKSGKQYTIGTQKIEELKKYLDNANISYSSTTS